MKVLSQSRSGSDVHLVDPKDQHALCGRPGPWSSPRVDSKPELCEDCVLVIHVRSNGRQAFADTDGVRDVPQTHFVFPPDRRRSAA